MDLLNEIAHCPNVKQCLGSQQSGNPCYKIVSIQNSNDSYTLDQHQVPEPWSGDIEHAKILFLGLSPSFDEVEEFPLWSWPDAWVEDFFTHRYSGGRKQWIENGTHNLLLNGSRQHIKLWSHVRNRAKELLEREVNDGIDYALTDVVHCKSKGEADIREALIKEALQECTGRYLRRVVELSGAKVIVVLGSIAKDAMRKVFSIPDVNMVGPIYIGQLHRYIAFLPLSSAYEKRTFETRFDKESLQELRAFLKK